MSKLLLITFDGGAEGHQLAGFAQKLGLPFDVLCISGEAPTEIGAARVLNAGLAEVPPADALAEGLKSLVAGYSHIAGLSNMRSKDVLARLAGLIEAGMVTDVIGLQSPTSFTRPMVAGSVIATVEVLAEPVILTVRPAGFPADPVSGSSPVESVTLAASGQAQRISVTARGGARPDLSQARVVVSGGRPLGDAETFERVIGGFADALGGAAGATRAAVDSGIAANELQVGQTGKIVAPELYIAAGISGSTQHMAGIKDSKLIVAINKDPDAPIFEFADLGLVGDLFEVIPEIRAKLSV
ncbi:MAG TPA: FAD-binding protein [Fimbriimonadaceae bacterium]|nr:FAD-binding protein [Fimbriimonadaceae bacterium]HRJ32792.1 FAD-binding protein [Fimbriimonadaceae bacterium]